MQYDAIVIGGSYAGLSAAMQLARARRKVCIVDSGKPRNRFAAASHGFFGMDGAAPHAMIAQAREKVLAYPSVTFTEGQASSAAARDGGFEVGLASGQLLSSRKLVLAYGMVDRLPEVPGLSERWGKTVLHCPYCHGYEFADQQLGVLAVMPMSTHQAQLISEWGPTTLFLHEQAAPDAETAAKLAARGVTVESSRVLSMEDAATMKLADGRRVELAALYIGPQPTFASSLHAQLGCALEDTPIGAVIRADEKRETSVPGVFAAGDISRMMSNASIASADGVMAGAMAHQQLVFG